MTISGVGPVAARAYTATIDISQRFRNSKTVGSILGLTPVLNQLGESHRVGRVSLCGDGMMPTLLYESAQSDANARQEVVMAQGLGNERRQAVRSAKASPRMPSSRRAKTPICKLNWTPAAAGCLLTMKEMALMQPLGHSNENMLFRCR